MFWGKVPYFIDKSHIRRSDSLIYSMAYLEMLLLMILIEGLLTRTIQAVSELPQWQPYNLFIGRIPKWPPNDVIHF